MWGPILIGRDVFFFIYLFRFYYHHLIPRALLGFICVEVIGEGRSGEKDCSYFAGRWWGYYGQSVLGCPPHVRMCACRRGSASSRLVVLWGCCLSTTSRLANCLLLVGPRTPPSLCFLCQCLKYSTHTCPF